MLPDINIDVLGHHGGDGYARQRGGRAFGANFVQKEVIEDKGSSRDEGP